MQPGTTPGKTSSTTSRCSTIRSVVTDLTTGFRQQSLSEGILNGSRVSSRLVAIHGSQNSVVSMRYCLRNRRVQSVSEIYSDLPPKNGRRTAMHSPSPLKWILFILFFGSHLLFSWLAFQFDWLLVEVVAMWPVLILESIGIKLSSCYQFICLPNMAGWAICVLSRGGIHYLIATLLNKMIDQPIPNK